MNRIYAYLKRKAPEAVLLLGTSTLIVATLPEGLAKPPEPDSAVSHATTEEASELDSTKDGIKQAVAVPKSIREAPSKAASATDPIDRFERSYTEAVKALKERRYDSTHQYLEAASHEARQTTMNRERYFKVRLLEAQLANRTGKQSKAMEMLKSLSGGDRPLILSELAESEDVLGYFVRAENNSRKALGELDARKAKLESDDEELDNIIGLTCSRLARSLAGQGFIDEAKPLYSRARTLLTAAPGLRQLDLADALRHEAIFYKSIGDNRTCNQLFETSCRIREASSDPERPAALEGEVRFDWEPGSPRSHEIIDNEFPLRYITANNIRVAATVIDLWELAGIIVCVTNLDDHRRLVDLGSLQVYHAVKGPGNSLITTAPLTYVDHKIIDRLRRELNIWDLTQDRPWLANIQKTRNFRGLVPSDGHDMFRGPNVFGVWGEWAGISHVVSKVGVTVQPSRENLFHRNADDDISKDTGLVRSQGIQQNGYLPISLEPFESRTGEKFYLYPRNEPIKIEVVVGNTTFSFPFQCRKRRI